MGFCTVMREALDYGLFFAIVRELSGPWTGITKYSGSSDLPPSNGTESSTDIKQHKRQTR